MTVHPLPLTRSPALPIIYPTRGGQAPRRRSAPRELPLQQQTGRRPILRPEDKDALFALQQDVAVTDRELAGLAGVTVSTISNWRAARKGKATSIPRRQVVIERPDGTILRIYVSAAEMTRLIDLKAHA